MSVGVDAAISFPKDVLLSEGTTTGPAYVWSKHFSTSMAKGNAIEEAAIYASDMFKQKQEKYSWVDKFLISGDPDQTIAPTGCE